MELEKLHSQFVLYKEIAQESIQKGKYSSVSQESSQNNTQDDAVVVSLGEGAFQQELNKHIHDYYSGEGHLSQKTARKIKAKNQENIARLADFDPQASSLYAGYQTLSSGYGRNARMVSNLSNTTKQTQKLYSLGQELKKAK